MPSLAELRRQKLVEQKAEVKEDEKPITFLKKEIEKKPKKPKKSNAIKIKTDNFRTGFSNITTLSKRDKPPILKQKLMVFLESHDLIKIDNTWNWIKKEMI